MEHYNWEIFAGEWNWLLGLLNLSGMLSFDCLIVWFFDFFLVLFVRGLSDNEESLWRGHG